LLRFAEMHRQGGVWDSARVVSDRWIEEAWTPRTHSPFSGDDYRYRWFISSAAGRKLFYARGYGGQLIYIVPSLDLTVVVTSDPTRPRGRMDMSVTSVSSLRMRSSPQLDNSVCPAVGTVGNMRA
jgi:CubicO group peptidase (beta-lactamase class C family)